MVGLDLKEIEAAIKILLEGYKRVNHGEKEVKLSDVLKSVSISPPEYVIEEEKEFDDADDLKDNTQESKKNDVIDRYVTKSKNKISSIEDAKVQVATIKKMSQVPGDPNVEEDEDDQEDGETVQGEAPQSIVSEELKEYQDKIMQETKDALEEQIGRYVPGFRHYENYESYEMKFPNRTIDDYYNDIYREVSFEEYLEISKTASRVMIRVIPELRIQALEITNNRPEALELIFESDEYEEKLRAKYAESIRKALEIKRLYHLIDCLEEHTDMMYYGDMSIDPKTSVHIPDHSYIVPFHKFVKQIDDPQSLESLTVGANDFLNPMKALPIAQPQPVMIYKATKQLFKSNMNRKQGMPLSKPRFFSTTVGGVLDQMEYPTHFEPFVVKK